MKNKETKNVRLLNMEEKRKLEKLIFIDIDKAKLSLVNKQKLEKEELEKNITKSKEVQKLIQEYKKNRQRNEEICDELHKMNLSLTSWHEEPTVQVDWLNKDYQALSLKHKIEIDNLDNLKREYTLKLFAGGEEAQNLFATLSKELEKLI